MVLPNHSTHATAKEESVDTGLSLTGWTADGNMRDACRTEYPDRCRGGQNSRMNFFDRPAAQTGHHPIPWKTGYSSCIEVIDSVQH